MSRNYILLTAARNESQYISTAIESVLDQTIRPVAWFIVDDGSSDQTGEIIRSFGRTHTFIKVFQAEHSSERSFGSKDKAINVAFALARELDFDFVGIQDADISFERSDYYQRVLDAFRKNQKLGVSGGYIHELGRVGWASRKANSPDSVAGAIQMFRRECFEQIGGYTPLHFGGEDWLAQLNAKMFGWEVAADRKLVAYHHRCTSSVGGRPKGLFRLGMMDASFGSHPLFELFKCVRRASEKPLVVGSIIRLSGYCWWKACGRPAVVERRTIEYLRKDQLGKIVMWLRRMVALSSTQM
jgi:glycosyltransferase involved in cell wall biosynthesis